MKVAVGSLGGTVSMTAASAQSGVTPKLTAADLVQSVPGLADIADIHAESILKVPSGYLKFDDVLHCLSWAKQQCEAGVNGVVLTQGTDTLEETAFLLDLFWDQSVPLVLTGAMRPPQKAGAEGPANLLAAVIVAGAVSSRDRGVLVVMNNNVSEARWVSKNHSADVDAFHSQTGFAGIVIENQVAYFKTPAKRMIFKVPTVKTNKVFMWETSLSDEGEVLDWAAENAQGVVVSAFGAGHVPLEVADRLERIAKTIPVIVCTRTGNGPTANQTYGYLGAEIDLQKRGIKMGGWLSPRKARLLLWVIVSNQLTLDQYDRYTKTLTY